MTKMAQMSSIQPAGNNGVSEVHRVAIKFAEEMELHHPLRQGRFSLPQNPFGVRVVRAIDTTSWSRGTKWNTQSLLRKWRMAPFGSQHHEVRHDPSVEELRRESERTLLSMPAVAQRAEPPSAPPAPTAPVPNSPAMSNAQVQTTIPANSVTVTNWYKQSVYDPSDSKIGEIMDVLLDKAGKVTALIVGVGGFLGAGEKDVAVPFEAIQITNKNNNKWYLVMNSTKDSLKAAPGFKYDRDTTSWVPDKK
jgi:sporulation protein YlmC with PRC-barrel domain